ncbi:hypothetical protein DUNSADRAFT_11847 [Dunaliella salina]|uniref:Uncharacterized protein n=1 Tax=Dunaliella salina TaxID=3046 RepID=A0ABQ7GCF7_DUNSA|nr:hypothetical protein DUNSADRAFT_11847 [Dunaliella salina]|eukprot:KAF5832282.1 hypothetical protein DUNSADRAFT_11847 [Dunaliella salina]
MLERAMQEDPARCEWLLACLITAVQHASEAGLQDFAGARAPVASEQRGPGPATAASSTPTLTSSSNTTTATNDNSNTTITGSRVLGQGGSHTVHDGGVLWPPGTAPSLRSSCSDHRTARQASLVATVMRQLGAAAVQTLGSSLLLSPGRQAGAGSHGRDKSAGTGAAGRGTSESHGSSISTGEQAGAGSHGTVHAQQHGGPQRGASRGHTELARSACLVQSLECMAGLLEHGSTCLGEYGSSCPGEGGTAGSSMHATAAVSLMAAAGLLEGLEVQLRQLYSPTQAHIRNQLELTTRRLVQPLRLALDTAACARLMRSHTLGSCPFPPNPSDQYSSFPPCQSPTDQGLSGSSSCHQTSSVQTISHTSEQFLRARRSGQSLASFVWPELVGAQGLTDACAVHAVHAVPPLASPLLTAMVQQGRELLPWVAGIIASRLLALPQLMHALLPSSQHPFFVQQALQQRPASTPAVAAGGAAAASHLREVLLRSMLPSLAACALLECSLGLDVLALLVLEAAPPEAANAWLQGLAAGDDPLFHDAPALARCIVNAVVHPPLSQSPPSSSPRNKPTATSKGAPDGALSQAAHPQAPSAGIAQGEHGARGSQEWDYRGSEVVRVCQNVGLQSLLEALQRGGARASARYALVALHAPPCWLSSLNGAALRDLMDRLFVSAVAPLPALLSAWPKMDIQGDPVHGPKVSHGRPPTQQHAGHHHQQQQNLRHPQQHGMHHQQQQNLPHSQLFRAISEGCCRSRASARMLLLLGHLQFCRVQLPMLAGLIRRLVWEVVQEPVGCAAFLDGMPSYQELLQPVFGVGAPTGGSQGVATTTGGTSGVDSSSGVGKGSVQGVMPVWMADAVLGARMLFLLPIAATCVSRVSCPHEAAEQLLPFLYLLHDFHMPLSGTALSAVWPCRRRWQSRCSLFFTHCSPFPHATVCDHLLQCRAILSLQVEQPLLPLLPTLLFPL